MDEKKRAATLRPAQLRHLLRVTAATSRHPERDALVLLLGMTCAMRVTEIARVLAEDGAYRIESEVRSAIAFNGRRRPIFWTNARVREAFDAYLAERTRLRHGVTAWRSQWRGLVQLGLVFLTNDGRPFTLTTRKTGVGNVSRSCESVTQTIRKLHDQAGIEAAGATAARRTFAVRLHRKAYDLRHIREVLGLASLSATKNLVKGDPVDLGRIVARPCSIAP